ncbi:hypothetical protein BT67DRAFT_446931 [Trichocladium antarcticum]|uniref:S-adenosyl-L-methionine-dependent methyltransferase n=1 Tax=Trichocladium antarcticum TaxID=1450529 RepID=A0AAN6UU25_9PEZI|nr:hypothetical protein BT67DRAFT_446931 [Trichocladium antarcticum]
MFSLPPPYSSFVDPWKFMALAMSFLPATILAALFALDLATLLSLSRLRSAWFGRFWARVGPDVRANAEKNVTPLLRGHVARGAILPPDSPAAYPPLSGTILELGPGSGMWTSLFAPRSAIFDPAQPGGARAPPLTKVYGIEPNTTIHPLLRDQIARADLGPTTYEIVPLGVQDLKHAPERYRIQPNSIDNIVTIMCLCSIPEPRENMAELYGYLKPGGRWYAYEHVKCHASQGKGMSMYQAFLNCIWPHIIGGCEMGRDTGKWLREAGPWRKIDLCPLENEPWYYTMPHVIGVLTK